MSAKDHMPMRAPQNNSGGWPDSNKLRQDKSLCADPQTFIYRSSSL